MASAYASKSFWLGVRERAIKTAAQTAVAGIGTGALVQEVSWGVIVSTVGLAVILSVLTALADPDRTDLAVATHARGLAPGMVYETVEVPVTRTETPRS